MDNPEQRDRFRYALSYLEKAQRDTEAASPHARSAESLLAQLREVLQRERTEADDRLRALLAEQTQLSQRVTKRKVSAADANALNRRLSAQIAEQRKTIAELDACLTARSANDLGGFIDLPIEAYSNIVRSDARDERRARSGDASAPRRSVLAAFLARFIEPEPTVAGIQLKPTRVGLAVWIVCVLIALAGSLVYLDFIHIGPALTLDPRLDSITGKIQVACRNTTRKSVAVTVAYLDETTPITTPSGEPKPYEIRVDVREQASDEFRADPYAIDCWSYGKTTFKERWVFDLTPHMTFDLVFDQSGQCHDDGIPRRPLDRPGFNRKRRALDPLDPERLP